MREPILNIPSVVGLTLATLVLVHLGRLLLSPEADFQFVLTFAFVPARTMGDQAALAFLPGGEGARWWTLITYAFLHGDGMHLGVNAFWIAAFGTPVARRFGTARFLAISAASAVAGILTHLAIYPFDTLPVIGASAAASGMMGAAARFVFAAGGPLDMMRRLDPLAPLQPAEPLSKALVNPRVIGFVAIWMGLNVLFGLGASAVPGVEGTVAWQAHIGGFLAGLVAFPLFDGATAARRQAKLDELLAADRERYLE